MRPRRIEETEEFLASKEAVISEIGLSEDEFEDFRPVWDYVLARRPELYPQVLPGVGVRFLRTRPGFIPSLLIWYAHDDEVLYLLDIKVAPNGTEED